VESVDRSLLRGGRREGSTESTDTADELVERIRALRREGREEEARTLLRALTERYPAFELPRDLRDLR
jgi:molybdenum-dependent DNA-binding transcriptional regulator ModE